MDRLALFTLIFFISITLSYGLNHNRKKFRTLEDFNDLPDLTHVKDNNYHSSVNTKRMAMDDNTRSRESWGQMNQMSQYYPNPVQYPANGNYYRNMPIPTTNNNNGFFTTASPIPNTNTNNNNNNNEPMGTIYKDANPNFEQTLTPMNQKPKPGIRGKLNKSGNVETYDYERVGMLSNPNDKKVKILICRLQNDHSH